MRKWMLLGLLLAGCSDNPGLRPEPVTIKGAVKLSGASPKDLTITFQPTQNVLPGAAKVGSDGAFEVKLVPGKYIPYFQDEANLRVLAYKKVPTNYRSPSENNLVTVSAGSEVVIDLK